MVTSNPQQNRIKLSATPSSEGVFIFLHLYVNLDQSDRLNPIESMLGYLYVEFMQS
jgi:hypothetical protein